MAAVSQVSSKIDVDSQLIAADRTKKAAVLFVTILELLETTPELTFQKIEHLLRKHQCFFHLIAHSFDPNMNLGLPFRHSFHVLMYGPEDPILHFSLYPAKVGELIYPRHIQQEDNSSRLVSAGFSSLPLTDLYIGSTPPALFLNQMLELELLSPSTHCLFSHQQGLGLIKGAIGKKITSSVLEVGSGYGSLSGALKCNSRWTISDDHKACVTTLKARAPSQQVVYYDPHRENGLAQGSKFDTIVLNDALFHTPKQEWKKVCEHLYSHLEADGHLLYVSTPETRVNQVFKQCVNEGDLYWPVLKPSGQISHYLTLKFEDFSAYCAALPNSYYGQMKKALKTYMGFSEEVRRRFCFSTDDAEAGEERSLKLRVGYRILAEGFKLLKCTSSVKSVATPLNEHELAGALKSAGFTEVLLFRSRTDPASILISAQKSALATH